METRTSSSEVTEMIFKAIDETYEEEVSFLKQLIHIPTVNPPGRYEEVAAYLTSYGKKHGLSTEIHETPSEVCKSAGVEGDERRLSVKMSAGSRGCKPRILLLAHLDTVPIGDASSWRHDPFGGEIIGNRIYGRGALDCKGRIAGYLFAQLALVKALKELPFEVSVAATADEEMGGHTGAKYQLENGNLNCDYCIGEGYTSEVFNGFKGLLWAHVSIKGKSAHGATPQLGISVVPALGGLLRELKQYQTELSWRKETKDMTLNIGVVRAGTKINMVPDSASLEVDMRIGEEYGVQHVADDIRGIVDRLEKEYGGLTFSTEFLNRSEPIALSANHVLVRTVQSSVEEVTKTQVPVNLWFAHSDTLHFLKKGIPAVNYGVGRPGIAHTTDEYLDLDDLKLSTKAVALSVMKLGMA
jgi:succinyl-diaminopimelate desuccinylase